MTADLKALFDRAGQNPPDQAWDADAVLRRARRTRNRRIPVVVAVVVAVTLALGIGLATQRRLSAGPPPAGPLPAAPTLRSLGRLAYGINGDIYLADPDGRNRVRIANGTPTGGSGPCGNYRGEGPMWSPDGRHLAYRGEVGGAGSCHQTVNISDAAGHRVASFPGQGWVISWSPDSTRVATWVDLGHTIGIYGLDGVRQALLTVPPGLMAPGDFDPLWAPDGASLVVPDGVEIPLDGSAPRVLPANDPRVQGDFASSPDETRVAWIRYGTTESLIVADRDGSHARVLIRGGVLGFKWSPTGGQIAVDSKKGRRGTTMGPVTELRIVDLASGRVTSLGGLDGASTLTVIEFSPKGDQILFSSTDANNQNSLWSVRTDGWNPHPLVLGSDWGDWQSLSPTP